MLVPKVTSPRVSHAASVESSQLTQRPRQGIVAPRSPTLCDLTFVFPNPATAGHTTPAVPAKRKAARQKGKAAWLRGIDASSSSHRFRRRPHLAGGSLDVHCTAILLHREIASTATIPDKTLSTLQRSKPKMTTTIAGLISGVQLCTLSMRPYSNGLLCGPYSPNGWRSPQVGNTYSPTTPSGQTSGGLWIFHVYQCHVTFGHWGHELLLFKRPVSFELFARAR